MANILISALLSVVFVISKPVGAYAQNVSSLEIESEPLLGRKSVSDKGEHLVDPSNSSLHNCVETSFRVHQSFKFAAVCAEAAFGFYKRTRGIGRVPSRLFHIFECLEHF